MRHAKKRQFHENRKTLIVANYVAAWNYYYMSLQQSEVSLRRTTGQSSLSELSSKSIELRRLTNAGQYIATVLGAARIHPPVFFYTYTEQHRTVPHGTHGWVLTRTASHEHTMHAGIMLSATGGLYPWLTAPDQQETCPRALANNETLCVPHQASTLRSPVYFPLALTDISRLQSVEYFAQANPLSDRATNPAQVWSGLYELALRHDISTNLL